jgi:hypothetical protein
VIEWLAKWNTVGRDGKEWEEFQDKIADLRIVPFRNYYVYLYPEDIDASCIVFTHPQNDRIMACYDQKMIKKAIKFGLPVEIKDIVSSQIGELHKTH